ncbi:MAG TPA: hypothetical protein VM124_03205 [Candidatus Limnocylindrales bacterium]|nr:hypothetical protein [Candidatus Limnocylindrales bacterium]
MKPKLNISAVGKSGGVVSEVIEAQLEHEGKTEAVVVKRIHKKTEGPQFSYSDAALQKAALKNHALDRKILERLQEHPTITVPRLHIHYSRGRQTVMSDFNAHGYSLMQDRLIETTLPAITAVNAARTLANLQLALRDKSLMQGIKPVEDSKTQVRERLAEAHVLLYGHLDYYRELESKFLSEDGLLYSVGHPKNMAVNGSGDIMVFDFGRIITGSQQFVPANFLAHIGLAWIGGVMQPDKAQAFIHDFYEAFNEIIPIEEMWFVRFFAAELVHRGLAMRWIDPRMFKQVRKVSAKLAVHAVFLDVYENEALTLGALIGSLDNHASKLL